MQFSTSEVFVLSCTKGEAEPDTGLRSRWHPTGGWDWLQSYAGNQAPPISPQGLRDRGTLPLCSAVLT